MLDKLVKDDELIKNDPFLSAFERGLSGKNQALSVGFDDDPVSSDIMGIIRGYIMYISAMSGAGKTTLLDKMLISAWKASKENPDINLKITYYSFEISRMVKSARMVSMLLMDKYNIDISSKQLLGFQLDDTFDKNTLIKILNCYKEVKEFLDDIDFVDEPKTPADIRSNIFAIAEENGEIVTEEYTYQDSSGQEYEETKIVNYIPHDPRTMVLTAIDHIGLTKVPKGMDKKRTIDNLSEITVETRNKFNFSYIITQQMNTSLSATYRNNARNKNDINISPDIDDLADSKYTFRDCDFMVGLVKPSRLNVTTFKGKDISNYGDNFVIFYTMKDRYGQIGGEYPYLVDGGTSEYKPYIEEENDNFSNLDGVNLDLVSPLDLPEEDDPSDFLQNL